MRPVFSILFISILFGCGSDSGGSKSSPASPDNPIEVPAAFHGSWSVACIDDGSGGGTQNRKITATSLTVTTDFYQNDDCSGDKLFSSESNYGSEVIKVVGSTSAFKGTLKSIEYTFFGSAGVEYAESEGPCEEYEDWEADKERDLTKQCKSDWGSISYNVYKVEDGKLHVGDTTGLYEGKTIDDIPTEFLPFSFSKDD